MSIKNAAVTVAGALVASFAVAQAETPSIAQMKATPATVPGDAALTCEQIRVAGLQTEANLAWIEGQVSLGTGVLNSYAIERGTQLGGDPALLIRADLRKLRTQVNTVKAVEDLAERRLEVLDALAAEKNCL